MPEPAFTPEAWAIMDQILRLGFVVEFASIQRRADHPVPPTLHTEVCTR